MNVRQLHSWSLTPKEAGDVQNRLRRQLRLRGTASPIRFVAGADVSYKRGDSVGYAAVVVLTYPDLVCVETATAHGLLEFPYVPGLLTFREGPLLVQAFEKIKTVPDVVFFDGQGVAHPKQFGLACHMGILLNRPSIGCAKTKLVGSYDPPGLAKGSWSSLHHGFFTLGRAVRTRTNVKPIFVSPGHQMNLRRATELALSCCTVYRLPEPTRLAHHAVSKVKTSS